MIAPTRTHVQTQTQTHIHTHIHARTHTHIHTHTQLKQQREKERAKHPPPPPPSTTRESPSTPTMGDGTAPALLLPSNREDGSVGSGVVSSRPVSPGSEGGGAGVGSRAGTPVATATTDAALESEIGSWCSICERMLFPEGGKEKGKRGGGGSCSFSSVGVRGSSKRRKAGRALV